MTLHKPQSLLIWQKHFSVCQLERHFSNLFNFVPVSFTKKANVINESLRFFSNELITNSINPAFSDSVITTFAQKDEIVSLDSTLFVVQIEPFGKVQKETVVIQCADFGLD